jgi:ABC-type nickel/cobalt efflux system permease component RcnA/Tol biopolymer transport system component
MRPIKPLLFFLLILLLLIPLTSAQAHPADMYIHTFNVTITPQGVLIGWEIKPGPMLASWLWHEADGDADETVNPQEARAWGEARVMLLTSTVDSASFPLKLDNVKFPADLNALQASSESILLTLSASWPQDGENTHRLILHNGMEEQSSVNWFVITAIDEAAFKQPLQQSSQFAVDLVRERERAGDQSGLLTTWDSGTPSLPPGQKKDVVMQTAEQVIPELAQESPQEILIGLVSQEQFSIPFYILALGISLALGALHALTPGHGKTVVAAYLVGTRGTTRHAIALGSIVTLTHTGSVFLLGIVTLVASRYILPTRLIPALEVLSGLLILGLGLYLFFQRIRDWHASKDGHHHDQHDHAHEHGHDYHHHDLDHEHGHSHQIPDPESVTWKSLIALGVSGGLVPCPDAIAILLVAIAINRLLLGLALIIAFSLGLAVVLIAIGLAMVHSRRLFRKIDAFTRFAPAMPVVSAVIVLVLGVALTWGALRGFGGVENTSIMGADTSSAHEAGGFRLEASQVIYLSEDEDGHKQLVVSNMKGETARVLTDAPRGVNNYALSPDRTQVIYVHQAADLGVSLWLARVDGSEAVEAVTCNPADCSQPVWSPDGNKVVYERLDYGSEGGGLGLPTLWWLDVENGETQPVFQETQLPGVNPRWSPDGNWLSYSTPDGSIRLYNLATGENRILDNFLGAAAVWSPDSSSVLLRDVLTQEQGFVTHLFRYDLESDALTDLNDDPNQENNLAAWSPDGEWLAVVRRDLSVSMGDQVWLLRTDGSQARQLTEAPNVLHGGLDWSLDGGYILFDGYMLDIFPLEARVQVLDVESGEVMDLGVKGYSPRWVW